MNSFDAVVYLAAAIAAVAGFMAGFLRSMVTILGYLVAMPIAVWATALLSPAAARTPAAPLGENSMMLFGIFLIAGIALGKMLRIAIDDWVGAEIGLPDRLAGATLGAIRVALVAMTLALVFDRLVPADRQPAFLVGSHLRPLLSQTAQRGFKALPPDLAAAIDRLKQQHRI